MSQPQRPSRGGGRPNEQHSTGLLVNVIRTLTTTASTEQREFEKRRLEHGFNQTGRAIDALISSHQADLTLSLQSFRKVSSRITAARERVRSVRNNLSSCKSLLQCKRSELHNLWLESAEQKHVARLLADVEQIKTVPAEAQSAVSNRQYLKAAELLLCARVSLEGDLKVVDGLVDVRHDLMAKDKAVFDSIVSEIYQLLYLRPSEEQMYELFKGASRRNTEMDAAPLLKAHLADGACLKLRGDETPLLHESGCARDLPTEPSEEAPVQLLAVLAEAGAVLRRTADVLDSVTRQIKYGLSRQMSFTVQFYGDWLARANADFNAAAVAPSPVGDGRQLAELLQLIFRQFKATATLHVLLLRQLNRIKDTRHLLDLNMYSMDHVWTQMQACLQQLLEDYLDVTGAGAATLTAAASKAALSQAPAATLSSYFSKKRPARQKHRALFSFDATAHSISVSTFVKEQRLYNGPSAFLADDEVGGDKAEQVWVCPPTPANIAALYRPVSKFCADVESHMATKGACQLRLFLDGYVKTTYLPRVQIELRNSADAALQSADSWNSVVGKDEQQQQHVASSVPVLTSSARTLDLCLRVGRLMESLPPFAEQLAALWLLILNEYRGHTQRLYDDRTLRRPDADRRVEQTRTTRERKISAAWAVDEDISRLLKSLPNWTNLVVEPLKATPLIFSPPTAPQTPVVENAEQVRRRNERESEILIGNLGTQKQIADWEVISDAAHIRSLANIHESLEWFCESMRRALAAFAEPIQARLKTAQVEVLSQAGPGAVEPETSEIVTLSDGLERRLTALDEMAANCLLMLHLEVRVRCFYHLLPLARQASHVVSASESQEADARVLSLNRDLVQLQELLGSQMQHRKIRFLFEGLGHLVSVIFINSSHYMSKINENGKKRMCRNMFSIQQCLSGLTNSREPDLDRARKFFELLYKGPDEILTGLVEKGPKFSEQEYQYLISLAIRSHPVLSTEPGALDQRLGRLRQVMLELSKSPPNT